MSTVITKNGCVADYVITNKQQKRNPTQTTDIYFKTSTWKSFVNPWRALSTHVKTRRTEAKILLAGFTEH